MRISDTVEVRHGGYEQAFATDEVFDALITDTPFSDHTHSSYDEAANLGEKALANNARWAAENGRKPIAQRAPFNYTAWTEADARSFVRFWAPRTKGWMVVINDEFLAPIFKNEMEVQGRCVFALLPFYSPGSRIRISGDGPSNWTCWISVSRPRMDPWRKWGTLPGGYAGPPEDLPIVGGKPLWLKRALVRDYTMPGDKIAEPCCGAGTTPLAATIEGRSCVASEIDEKTYDLACARLSRPYTGDMFGARSPTRMIESHALEAEYERGVTDGRQEMQRHVRDALGALVGIPVGAE